VSFGISAGNQAGSLAPSSTCITRKKKRGRKKPMGGSGFQLQSPPPVFFSMGKAKAHRCLWTGCKWKSLMAKNPKELADQYKEKRNSAARRPPH
jgi:hypothetical protein